MQLVCQPCELFTCEFLGSYVNAANPSTQYKLALLRHAIFIASRLCSLVSQSGLEFNK